MTTIAAACCLLGLTLAPAPRAEEPPPPRERAAAHLERGLVLARRPGTADGEALRLLDDVADRAARELAGRPARLLRDAAAAAKWRAYLGEAGAWRDLAARLDERAGDLLFEPVLEAERPTGWPEPTPVLELRLLAYPEYRLARAPMGLGENGAFWVLFGHIKRNEIAMTAPVEMTYDARDERLRGEAMAFLYGDPGIGEAGERNGVEVVDVSATHAVSIGCRGRRSADRVREARADLEAWIDAHEEWERDGPLRVMGWNSPMVPASRQYFEVQLPVRRVETVAEETAVSATSGR